MNKTSKIIVPNDMAFIKAVLAFAGEVSAKAGFSGHETGEITLALKEACENVINHAFDPGEEESFTVTFDVLGDGLRIVIDEMGLPFSFEEAEKNGPSSPGLRAIEKNMDDVFYINRGKEGKELQLFKYLKGRHIEELLRPGELAPYESCELPQRDEPLAVRLMRPEEAVEVSRCIYRAYKYTYLNEDLYFPERIAAKNRDGGMVSCVAVTEKGDVAGHFALMPRPNRKVAEIGVAVVKPQYRRRGIMQKMLDFLIDRAMELGLLALYGNAVTIHKQSQKTNLKFGFHETALTLGVFPPRSIKPVIDRGLRGAGDIMTFFKYLRRAEPCEVFLPPGHGEMLRKTYANLALPRSFGAPGRISDARLPEHSVMELTLKHLHKSASVDVKSYGRDMEKRIRAKQAELLGKGFNSIYLNLDLRSPYTPRATELLEGLGFFYAGLFPDYSDGDILTLQHYNTDVEYGEILTASPFGLELLNYVKGLDPRWRAMHGG